MAGEKQQARVLGSLDYAIAKKLARRGQDMGDTTHTKVAERGLEPTRDTGTTTPFKLSGESLYGGQGKDNSLVTPNCIDNTAFGCEVRSDQGGASNMEGLCPPRLELTGDRVRGDMKRVLHKENRQHRCKLKTMQATTSQWTPHSRTMSPTMPLEPHECLQYRNSMCPRGRALSHPAAYLLTEWATFGCPTQTGQPWSKEEIWEAVARGPHKLALSPEALAHFAEEAAEKV
jgi:hypothetical protein